MMLYFVIFAYCHYIIISNIAYLYNLDNIICQNITYVTANELTDLGNEGKTSWTKMKVSN
jgi:hypothetical protein